MLCGLLSLIALIFFSFGLAAQENSGSGALGSGASAQAAKRRGDVREFRVAFVGDPQVDDSLELDFARRTIYRELRESRDIDFALIMGDIVNEKPELLPPSKASLDSLPFPYLCLPGNHDRGLAFNEVFGYGDTTFVALRQGGKWRLEGDNPLGGSRRVETSGNKSRPGVRFVLMNNILSGFAGGFRPEQLEWLRDVVGHCDKRQRLVFACHIPLRYCEGRDSVLSILSAHPRALLVSAHLHQVFRDDVSLPGEPPVEEIGVGATCGSWWRGLVEPVLVEGADTVWTRGAVPNARMNCGAPRGYFVTAFKSDGSYSSRYKRVGRDASDVASVRRTGEFLYVNVYGGHTAGRVRLEVSGWNCGSDDCEGSSGGNRSARVTKKYKLECTRTDTVAPEVQEIIDYNDSVPRRERKARRRDFIPMRRLSSPHLWICALPEELRGEPLQVKIKYSDPTMRFSLRTKAE